jgi:hypothetical protein
MENVKYGIHFPTYEQVLNITNFVAWSSNIVFVSSKFVAGIKRDRNLNTKSYCQ